MGLRCLRARPTLMKALWLTVASFLCWVVFSRVTSVEPLVRTVTWIPDRNVMTSNNATPLDPERLPLNATDANVTKVLHLSGSRQSDDNGTTHVKVLLQSYYRGGSSLLGAMLSSNPEAFYFFEPLHYTVKLQRKSRSSRAGVGLTGHMENYRILENGTLRELSSDFLDSHLQTLNQTFSCDVSSLREDILTSVFFRTAQQMPKLRGYGKCLRDNSRKQYRLCAKPLDSSCLASNITVVKAVRYPMYLIPELLKLHPDLKVVHYVRDPRAVIVSRKTKGRPGDALRQLCLEMSRNEELFRTFRRRYGEENFLFLRYEDLALNPRNISQTLYSFLKKAYPDNLPEWIQHNMYADRADWQYGVQRNAAETVHKWKKSLSKQLYSDMTKICRPTLDMLGYE